MEKDVLVKVRGLHIAPDTNSDIPIEVISRGDYYLKNGKHYLFYEEVMEGFNEVTKNRLIFTGDRLEITKSGVTSAHLLFENDKRNSTFYYTPFGTITVGIDTKSMNVTVSEDKITIDIKYALEMNNRLVSDCSIYMEITGRNSDSFKL